MGAASEEAPLAQMLRRCAEICEQSLREAWGDPPRSTPATSTIVLATSALQEAAAADADPDGRNRQIRLTIAATLAREALTVVRASGLEEPVLRCAEALDRAVSLCERALTQVHPY